MAVAITVKARDVSSLYRCIADCVFSGTYTTGGEAPTGGVRKNLNAGFNEILMMHGEVGVAGQPTLGTVASYNPATDKIVLWRVDQIDDHLEEVPNATSLTNVSLRAEFVGR